MSGDTPILAMDAGELDQFLRDAADLGWRDLARQCGIPAIRVMRTIETVLGRRRREEEAVLRHVHDLFPSGWTDDRWGMAQLGGKLAGFHGFNDDRVDHVCASLAKAEAGWRPASIDDPLIRTALTGDPSEDKKH